MVTKPSWEEIEGLASSGAVADRAFAAGAARLAARSDADRARALHVFATARARALADHAGVRAAIARGALRGAALRERIAEVDAGVRDHWVEEVLDLADPPLDEPTLDRELVGYVPAGVSEILVALDLDAGRGVRPSLIDVGAGMGKVVILAALLGYAARGLEIDPRLAARARTAAGALGVAAAIEVGDARRAPLGEADVWFLYVPFAGAALNGVLDRIAGVAMRRRVTVCASPIDLERHRWLRRTGVSSGWLEVHESGSEKSPRVSPYGADS